MLESFNSDKLEYQKLSPEEMKERHILGRLVGVIADYKHPTRNGRLYSEALWDKTFSDPIMQEKIKNRCLFGELGHPEDRLEIDIEKVAICMAEQPKKGKDHKLYSIFDILDTPNGKILKTLCDYGCTIGVSSRGNGEVDTDYEGNESVIPETYQCECWDAVLIPAVESARMTYMTESLGNKTLKQALNESLEKANPEDKKVMEETLKDLRIDYSDKQSLKKDIKLKLDSLKDTFDWALEKGYTHRLTSIFNQIEDLEKKLKNINEEYTHESDIDKKSDLAVDDIKANMVKTLQESLLAKEQAEAKITELQEKLSVCYAKEAKDEENISKYKVAIRNLSEAASNVKVLQGKIKDLIQQLADKDKLIEEKENQNKKLLESNKIQSNNKNRLSESLSSKERALFDANQKITSLNEQLNKERLEHEEETTKLQENYQTLNKDYKLKESQYSNKLDRANKLIEQYKVKAQIAINRYIESKALVLGITSQEIKNRLTENYTFDDIDNICESLSNYSLQINNLPFNLRSVKKVTMTESKEIPGSKNFIDDGDDVDDDLVRLATNLMN